jgi:AraC family transcriptional regulator
MLQQSTALERVGFLPTAFDLWRQNSASRAVGSTGPEEEVRASGTSRMMTPLAGIGEVPGSPMAQIIRREQTWFDTPSDDVFDFPRTRISASRWVGHATNRDEQEAELEADCHIVGIALQPMADVTVFAGRKLILSGHLPQGSMRVNEPGVQMRGSFRGSYDVLHLHVPNIMIAEYANSECARTRTTPLIADRPIVDPVIERLAGYLIHAEKLGGIFGQSYADGISLAITAHLFGGNSNSAPTNLPRVSGLSKWRLKRAIDYVMANLAEPISLADIAAATGLSRMHFAAQFRVATGLRPHEYLLQRRIERAQELLLSSHLPLVDIAFEVGFKTQAHFTTVFSRMVGETPNAWRQRNRGASASPILEAA